MFAVLEQHNDQVQSISWKRDGSLLASSCKVMTSCSLLDESVWWAFLFSLFDLKLFSVSHLEKQLISQTNDK